MHRADLRYAGPRKPRNLETWKPKEPKELIKPRKPRKPKEVKRPEWPERTERPGGTNKSRNSYRKLIYLNKSKLNQYTFSNKHQWFKRACVLFVLCFTALSLHDEDPEARVAIAPRRQPYVRGVLVGYKSRPEKTCDWRAGFQSEDLVDERCCWSRQWRKAKTSRKYVVAHRLCNLCSIPSWW